MKLAVFSLKNVIFEGEALSLNCKTDAGDITVLDNHQPLIASLAPGTVSIIDSEKKEEYFPIRSGFIHVQTGNAVRLIVDEA